MDRDGSVPPVLPPGVRMLPKNEWNSGSGSTGGGGSGKNKELIVRIFDVRGLPSTYVGKTMYCKLSLNSVHCRSSLVKGEENETGSGAKVAFEGEAFMDWGFKNISNLSYDDLLVVRLKFAKSMGRSGYGGVVSIAIRSVSQLGTMDSKAWFPLSPYGDMVSAQGEVCIGAYWTDTKEQDGLSFKRINGNVIDDSMSQSSIRSGKRGARLSLGKQVKSMLGQSVHKTQEMLVKSGAKNAGLRLDSDDVIAEGDWNSGSFAEESASDSEPDFDIPRVDDLQIVRKRNNTQNQDQDNEKNGAVEDDILTPLRISKSLPSVDDTEGKEGNVHPLLADHSRPVVLLEIIQGRGLLAADPNGLSDPYCIAKLKHAKRKTKVIHKTLTPVWRERLIFGGDTYPNEVVSLDDTLTIIVKDRDTVGFDDDLGMLELPLWAMTSRTKQQHDQKMHEELELSPASQVLGGRGGKPSLERYKSVDALFLNASAKWYSLTRSPGMSTVRGEIKLRVSYFNGTGASPSPFPKAESFESLDQSSGSNSSTNSFKKAIAASSNMLKQLDDKAKDFGAEVAIKAVGKSSLKSPDTPTGEAESVWEQLPNHIQTGPYAKTYTLLQVRVIQARNLIAADSNGKSDPYTIVRVRKAKRQTPTQRRTLNPVWNAAFEFGHAQEYFVETDVITVLVRDYDRLKKDDDLGVLTIPIWSIIDQKEPMWYALKPPGDPTGSTATVGTVTKDHGEIQLDFHFVVMGAPDLHFDPESIEQNEKIANQTPSPSRPLADFAKGKLLQLTDIIGKEKAKQYKPYNGKMWFYKMRITIVRAHGLPVMDDGGSLTSYFTVTCGPKTYRTKYVKSSIAPSYKERFEFSESALDDAKGLTRQDRILLTMRTPSLTSEESLPEFAMETSEMKKFGGKVLGMVTIDLGYVLDRMGYVDKDGTQLQGWFNLEKVGNDDNENQGPFRLSNLGFGDPTQKRDGKNKWKARVKLVIQLTPIAETRLMQREKMIVRVNRAKGLDGPSSMTSGLTRNIFVRVTIGSNQIESTVSRMTHGHVVCHEELYFQKLDEIELTGFALIQICLEETGTPYAELRLSIDELKIRPDRTIEGWFPLAFVHGEHAGSSLHEMMEVKADDDDNSNNNNNSTGRKGLRGRRTSAFANLAAEVPEVHVKMCMASVMEYLEPTLGDVDIGLIKLKMDTNDFSNNLCVVIRYGEKHIATKTYNGAVNIHFENLQEVQYRFPVRDVFTRFVFEVWNMPGPGSNINSLKTKKKLGAAEVSIYDLVEYEACAVFGTLGFTQGTELDPVKLVLTDGKGMKQGSLRLQMKFNENLVAGSLATHANPMARPKKPFSMANFRHEANRTFALYKGIMSVTGNLGYVLNWYDTKTTAFGLAVLVLLCVLDFWTSRFLALFPFCGLLYIMNRHGDRVYGRFALNLMQKSGIGENDTKARVLITAIRGRDLVAMDDNGTSDPLVHFSIVEGKPKISGYKSNKEMKLGRSRTEYKTLNPDWSGSPIGFKALPGSTLIQWGSSRDGTRVPAFEVFVPRVLYSTPVLEVIVVGTRSLTKFDVENAQGRKRHRKYMDQLKAIQTSLAGGGGGGAGGGVSSGDDDQGVSSSTTSPALMKNGFQSFKCKIRTVPHGVFLNQRTKEMNNRIKSGRYVNLGYGSGKFSSPTAYLTNLNRRRSNSATSDNANASEDEGTKSGKNRGSMIASGSMFTFEEKDGAETFRPYRAGSGISSVGSIQQYTLPLKKKIAARDIKTISWLPTLRWTSKDAQQHDPESKKLEHDHPRRISMKMLKSDSLLHNIGGYMGSSDSIQDDELLDVAANNANELTPIDKKVLCDIVTQPSSVQNSSGGQVLPAEKATLPVKAVLNPKWNQAFVLGTDYILDDHDSLVVTLQCSKANNVNKFCDLAYAFVSLKTLSKLYGTPNQVVNGWFPLEVMEDVEEDENNDLSEDGETTISTGINLPSNREADIESTEGNYEHLTKWRTIGEVLLSLDLTGLTHQQGLVNSNDDESDDEDDLPVAHSTKKEHDDHMIVSAAQTMNEPDEPWGQSTSVIVLDVFDEDDYSKREFLGRAEIPLSSLVKDNTAQEQPVFEAWIPLSLRFDGSKADKVLWETAQGRNFNDTLSVIKSLKTQTGKSRATFSSFLPTSTRKKNTNSAMTDNQASFGNASIGGSGDGGGQPLSVMEGIDLNFNWTNNGRYPFGEILVRGQVVLPEPGAEAAFREAEAAKKADTGGFMEQARMVMNQLQNVQDKLYGFNNTMEQWKNLFNWTHPRKTKFVMWTLLFLLVLFLVVPSRYIILFVGIFLFTERFRPLGVVAIKLNHLTALLPTNDDLVNLYTDGALLGGGKMAKSGSGATAMSDGDKSAPEVSKLTGQRFYQNMKDKYMTLGLRNQIMQAKSREAQESRFIVSESDCKAFGHLRILHNGRWKRNFFAIAHKQLLYWPEKEDLLIKVAAGGFGDFVEVSKISRDSKDAELLNKKGVSNQAIDCAFVIVHPEKFTIHYGDEKDGDEPGSPSILKDAGINTSKRIRTYLVANSMNKRDYWVNNLKTHCLTITKINKRL